MVLLAEQERLYADELVLVNDAGPYGLGNSTADWTLHKTYTITFSKQLIVLVRSDFTVGSASYGAGRIDLDDKTIWTSGGLGGTARSTPDMYFLLPSGSHTIKLYSACWFQPSTQSTSFTNIYIGQLNFNDALSGGPWDSGTISVGSTDTVMLNQDIAIPAGRTLPVGTIQQYSLFIFATNKDVGASPTRITHFKNPGESDDSVKLNTKLFINSTQVSWRDRKNDDADTNTNNPSYGRGGDGYYFGAVTPNQTLNIMVKCSYPTSSRNAECYMIVFLCPWITPAQDYQPVDLSFPQGSTFYAWLEPLYNNGTTFASKIGMKRFKSFGDSTDYYSVLSGMGILQHSYMLDVVDVGSATWVVSSTTIVCISYLAVDVR